ncbi:Cell wall-associated hydrolase, NlpC family [Caloramator quimbayensis]|uniref:Cell wall-associated hydrolase, NlpC family n=1 Tax=Caloramator quimbayensis TaxID=1147123 RepID=A0A1T4XYJ8_9CLOT|nr:C40 family peptidase [Caloramator quimbayensis]SKA94463.1 Cell wall-associated hydrolase, NlpC family [Caloramator quimbayensis]
MKKSSFLLILTLVLFLIIPITDLKVSAKASTSSKSNQKKTSVKTSNSNKTSKKTTKSSSKKKTTKRTTSKRGAAYSRGSGAVLGEGDVQRIVNYAKKYENVKYVYGSSSPKAFDCSGFTMYVYKAAGINLPHSASEQSKIGLAVSKDNLKMGDLVFFETGGAGISHVGIYIGNNVFIHASSGAGRVVTTSLSDNYYASRYRGATRIVN